MFELKLSQAGIFKKVLEAIRDLVACANFDCAANGFTLHAMDSSHVALVSLHLHQHAFEEFRCDKNRSLGLSLTNLAKLLKCCDNEDVLTINAEDLKDKVTFCIESSDHRRTSKFEIVLMDIDAEKLTIPKKTYSVKVSMPSGEFSKIIRDLSSIGDSIMISVTKSVVTFSTTGSIGTAEIICTQKESDDMETEDVSIAMTEPVSLQFAAKYLSSFTKATPLSERVLLRLAPERPIAVEYHIEEIGHIIYYLAPKIQDDDMDEEYSE